MRSSPSAPVSLLVSLALLSGCSSLKTQKDQFGEVDRRASVGDFRGAARQLEASQAQYYASKDRVLYYLDLGMLCHLGRDYARSNEMLTKAEDAIEELYTTSISKGALSLLLNDNALDYDGEDYEDVYLNVFKALNYLSLNQFDEAFVEVRRINNKLSVLEDKYAKVVEEYDNSDEGRGKFKPVHCQFNNSALGRYLSMLMYRADGQMDGARVDCEKINDAWRTQSQVYNFPMPDLSSSLKVRPGQARVSVIAFVGKSPELFARELTIHTFQDAVAVYTSDGQQDQNFGLIPWPSMTSGYHFKFSLPYMHKKGTRVRRAEIEIDGKSAGLLSLMESIENSAEDTFRMKETITYVKTIIRAVTKGIANEQANVELDKQTGGGLWGELTRVATSIAVAATENADLRLSRYFPSNALVGDVVVQPGVHSIAIRFFDANGMQLYREDYGRQSIAPGKLNFFHTAYLQ